MGKWHRRSVWWSWLVSVLAVIGLFAALTGLFPALNGIPRSLKNCEMFSTELYVFPVNVLRWALWRTP